MPLIYEHASKKERPLYHPHQDAALMPRGWSRVSMLRNLRSRVCACLLAFTTHIFLLLSPLFGCSDRDTVDNHHAVDVVLFWGTLALQFASLHVLVR